jgi:hypothetical protein
VRKDVALTLAARRLCSTSSPLCPPPPLPPHPNHHHHAPHTHRHPSLSYSNTWYSDDQRAELYATLSRYNTVAVIVGHTHSAATYRWNGTSNEVPPGAPGIDVVNVPAAQKGGAEGAAPSEYMVAELAVLPGGAPRTARFRVAQRIVGEGGWGPSSWGPVAALKNVSLGEEGGR